MECGVLVGKIELIYDICLFPMVFIFNKQNIAKIRCRGDQWSPLRPVKVKICLLYINTVGKKGFF